MAPRSRSPALLRASRVYMEDGLEAGYAISPEELRAIRDDVEGAPSVHRLRDQLPRLA